MGVVTGTGQLRHRNQGRKKAHHPLSVIRRQARAGDLDHLLQRAGYPYRRAQTVVLAGGAERATGQEELAVMDAR
jgi:hypothetical protein